MHVRGVWRGVDMTSLAERRFENLLSLHRLKAQELRRRLIEELEEIFKPATETARGEEKAQMIDGRQVRITLMQRQKWARAAAYIAQIIHTIAKGFHEREIDDVLEEETRYRYEMMSSTRAGFLIRNGFMELEENRFKHFNVYEDHVTIWDKKLRCLVDVYLSGKNPTYTAASVRVRSATTPGSP
jgi:hypothetical protein